jgi:hypothetical protein
MARDAALMMGRTGGLRGTSEGGALLRGGASTAAMSTAALTHRSHYGAARPHTADAGALSAAGHNQRGGRSMGGAGKARRASAAAGGAAEAAALEAARLQLFKDAHQVHARPPPPQGTSSFKVGCSGALAYRLQRYFCTAGVTGQKDHTLQGHAGPYIH